MCKALLEAGAQASNDRSGQRQAVHVAAEAGHIEVIEGLAAAGAQLDALDAAGATPLLLLIGARRWSEAQRTPPLCSAAPSCDVCGQRLPVRRAAGHQGSGLRSGCRWW